MSSMDCLTDAGVQAMCVDTIPYTDTPVVVMATCGAVNVDADGREVGTDVE